MGTAVIAGIDGVPILSFTDHIFNFMTSFVEICVVRELDFAAAYERYAWFYSALFNTFQTQSVHPIH
ncbi:MAG: hypothetical protein LBD34_02165 [Puniceicoccales bacterium]|nr:hypothetical protein [Puniceicoccales bacterium]